MSAIITEKFRLNNANTFASSFSSTDFKYYLFIGKSSPYTSTTTGGDDNFPPTPYDDVTTEYYKWDSMIAAKLISSSDVAYVIPRRTWANNTIYDMYEHDVSSANPTTNSYTNLWESSFYFVTSDLRVYKVLDNNGGVAYSGAEPTSTSTSPFFLGGYFLKYMYTITAISSDKFLTTDFIPVDSNVTVTEAAVDGSIDVVRITTDNGFTDGTYYAAINGDGSNGKVKIYVSGGEIQPFGTGSTKTELFANGSGYSYGYVNLTDVYSDSNLTTPANMGSGTGSVTPIIPPRGGHGYNSVEELGGHFVMVNVKLEQTEENDFTVLNDFRELGIIVNPYNFGTTTVSSVSTRRQTYAIKMDSGLTTGDFTIDEKITQTTTGAVGRVVDWDSTNKILYYVQERFLNYGIDSTYNYVAFSGTNIVTGNLSNTTGVPSSNSFETVSGIDFNSGYASPELEPDSGNIIYVENRRAINRAADQTEDIKIIVEF